MLFLRELEDLKHRISDARQRAVLVRGPVGVGKTALLSELARAEHSKGTRVLEAAGSRTQQSEPFGALTHLLPELDLTGEPREILRNSHRALDSSCDGTRSLIVVDDAHLLDDWSGAFLHQAVAADAAFVVAAVRHGEPVSQPIRAIAEGHGCETFDLTALSEMDAAQLIQSDLGGPVDTFAMTELIRLSGGNPAWLQRLLADARSRRALKVVDGVWQRTGNLADPGTAAAIAAEFLVHLSDDEVEVLDLLAIAESLELSTLEELTDLATVEAMEGAGFVQVDPVCPESTTSLVSESVREFLLQRMPNSRRIRLSRRLASAVPKQVAVMGKASDAPPSWLLEAGRLDDPEQCERGARLALANGDFPLAERFASTAMKLGDSEMGLVLRAEALLGMEREAEATTILATVLSSATEDAHVAQAALALMRHSRMFGGAEVDPVQIGESALARLESKAWTDSVRAELALHDVMAGDHARGAAFGSAVLDSPDANDRAALEATVVSSQAHVMIGRLDDAERIIHRGVSLASGLEEEVPMAEQLLDFAHLQTHLWAGRLEMAEQFSQDRLNAALRHRVPAWIGLWGLCSAAVKLFQGRVLESARGFCGALRHLEAFDPLRVVPAGRGWRALAEAQAGMLRAAQMTVESIEPGYGPGGLRIRSLKLGVEAWLRAQVGDTATAAGLTRDVGLEMIERSHTLWGCSFLHSAARFGHGDLVADDLEQLAPEVQSELVVLMTRHARAQAERDVNGLAEVSEGFSRIGAALLAAEASAQVAGIHGGRGDNQAAARAAARVTHLSNSTGGAETPALRQLDRFLTRREQEVAGLAMEGMSSREIAKILSISNRTVDNHLGSVYTKLGIHSREELPLAISGWNRANSLEAAGA